MGEKERERRLAAARDFMRSLDQLKSFLDEEEEVNKSETNKSEANKPEANKSVAHPKPQPPPPPPRSAPPPPSNSLEEDLEQALGDAVADIERYMADRDQNNT